MAAEIAGLLEHGTVSLSPSDAERARALAALLRHLLLPRCGYGYRFKRHDGCSFEVSAPGEHCPEHSAWLLADGTDPDPSRCPGVPLREMGNRTWVAKGMKVRVFGSERSMDFSAMLDVMRCPYPRRPDGTPCALHDPRPEDRCGWTESTTSEPCMEITALYGCPVHHRTKMNEDIEKIRLSIPCTYCRAPQGRPCKGRTEACNSNVHAARKKKTGHLVDAHLQSTPGPPNPRDGNIVFSWTSSPDPAS